VSITFLRPFVRQYPFDALIQQIVEELEKRNFKVPGIEVVFYNYGSGEQKFRMVQKIIHKDFYFWFCRKQCTLPGRKYNDIAAVQDLIIPKKKISVFSDFSGPSFKFYVGNDYDRDRERFFYEHEYLARLDKKEKVALIYTGRGNQLVPVGNHDSRMYAPEGDEPQSFIKAEIFDDFCVYLRDVVLPLITKEPIPEEKIDFCAPDKIIPLVNNKDLPIYTLKDGGHRDLVLGLEDPQQLPDYKRYVACGQGKRLVSWDVPHEDRFPKVAHKGFTWCPVGEVSENTSMKDLDNVGIPYFSFSFGGATLLRIKLNRANDVYVVDQGVYNLLRQERSEEIKQSGIDIYRPFTDKEVEEFLIARAKTLVPINDYKGDYKEPLVLIGRELSFDEVEIVSGPHYERDR